MKHAVLLAATCVAGATLVAAPASSAPTWQPITNLFANLSAAGGSAQTPAVDVDAAGNATALWSRYNGSQLVVQASTRPAGGTWTTPVDLAAGGSIFNPQLAVDPAGNVTAVWRRREMSTTVVQAASRPADGAWTAAVDLATDPAVDLTQQPDFPQLAVDDAGVVTATWARFDGKTYALQAASRAPGGTWTTPDDLSAPGQSARNPDIAVDPAGNATVVWVSGALIQSATRPAGGSWAAPVTLSTTAGMRANPRIVVDRAGTDVAIWGTFTGTYGIQSATRPPGGDWAAPVTLSAPGGDTFDTPQIAVDRQGTTTALWQRHDGSGWIVTSATLPAGGAWTTPVDLSATGHDSWDPQVAVDQLGNATAVWSLSDGKQRQVQAARRTADGTWSTPIDLSLSGGDAWNPQVAVDPAGNATTTWSRHDGTTWVVQARGLDAAGPVVTALTSRPTGQRSAYAVTAHDVWSTVASATWKFADGTTATGTSVTHASTGGSNRPVRVTLTDRVGNATVCTYTGTYSCRSTSRSAPVITQARLTQKKIRAASSHSRAKKSARAKVVLTSAAKVTLVFTRKGSKPIRLTKRGQVGKNAFTIRARIATNKTLRPGRWTITVTATNKAGTSVKEKLRLRVVR